jgi:VanZ family protein
MGSRRLGIVPIVVSQQGLKRLALAALAVYWLALFAGTHTPRTPHALELGGLDKWAHAGAYGGLAFLLAWNTALRRGFSWRAAAAIVCLLAAFGAFDELTQTLVGRDCDLLDWMADMAGTLVGLAAFRLATVVHRATRGPGVLKRV